MAHSIELLFDPDTEASLRALWDELAAAERPSRAPVGRPHVTLLVAERIDPDVDTLLRPLAAELPLPCAIGTPLLFGRNHAILTRLIVPTADLLAFHAEAHRICVGHLHPEPLPTSLPGQWTPHVTLARGVAEPALVGALRIADRTPLIEGTLAGLRRWNSDEKADYLIG